MSRNRLFNISLEDEVLDTDVGEVEEQSVGEVLEDTREVTELQADIEQDNVAMEEGEETIADLQKQVEENETVIEEKPEEVTEEMVQASNEALTIALASLRATKEDIKYYSLSQESGSSALERLKLSTESIKDVISEIIAKIRMFFKTVFTKIKQLVVKVQVMFSKIGKRAKELKDKVNSSDLKDDSTAGKASKETSDYFNSKFGVFFTANLGVMDILDKLDPLKLYNSINSKGSNSPISDIAKSALDINKFEKSETKGASEELEIELVPYRVKPDSVQFLKIENKLKLEQFKVINLNISTVSAKVENKANDSIEGEGLDMDTINRTLDILIKAGNNITKTWDAVQNEAKKADTKITEEEKKYNNMAENDGIAAVIGGMLSSAVKINKFKASRLSVEVISQYLEWAGYILTFMEKVIKDRAKKVIK